MIIKGYFFTFELKGEVRCAMCEYGKYRIEGLKHYIWCTKCNHYCGHTRYCSDLNKIVYTEQAEKCPLKAKRD